MCSRFVGVRVLAIDLEPVLNNEGAAVVVAKTRNEVEQGHSGQCDQSRVGREPSRNPVIRIIGRVARRNPAPPHVAGTDITTRRHALPGVADNRVAQAVGRLFNRAVIVVGADDAGRVIGPDGTGRLVLLLQAGVANVRGIGRGADQIDVSARIAGQRFALAECGCRRQDSRKG